MLNILQSKTDTNVIPSQRLDYHPNLRLFTQLKSKIADYPLYCTIPVQSKVTGKIVNFKMHKAHKYQGEVCFWEYRNSDVDVTIKIINA